jgi:hypothetical protein
MRDYIFHSDDRDVRLDVREAADEEPTDEDDPSVVYPPMSIRGPRVEIDLRQLHSLLAARAERGRKEVTVVVPRGTAEAVHRRLRVVADERDWLDLA